jgi:hydroxylamine dehydrogenase
VDDFYTAADAATQAVNQWVSESDQMVAPLNNQGLLTSQPFDEPIDFTYFELWHHWGRTAKFGVWMRGPDYTQWHGAYEILSDLAELRQMVDQKLLDTGLGP